MINVRKLLMRLVFVLKEEKIQFFFITIHFYRQINNENSIKYSKSLVDRNTRRLSNYNPQSLILFQCAAYRAKSAGTLIKV